MRPLKHQVSLDKYRRLLEEKNAAKAPAAQQEQRRESSGGLFVTPDPPVVQERTTVPSASGQRGGASSSSSGRNVGQDSRVNGPSRIAALVTTAAAAAAAAPAAAVPAAATGRGGRGGPKVKQAASSKGRPSAKPVAKKQPSKTGPTVADPTKAAIDAAGFAAGWAPPPPTRTNMGVPAAQRVLAPAPLPPPPTATATATTSINAPSGQRLLVPTPAVKRKSSVVNFAGERNKRPRAVSISAGADGQFAQAPLVASTTPIVTLENTATIQSISMSSQDMFSQAVTVITRGNFAVDRDPRPFILHLPVLKNKCPVLHEQATAALKDSPRSELQRLDLNSEAFHLFSGWLYTGAVQPHNAHPANLSSPNTADILVSVMETYLLGVQLRTDEFCSAVLVSASITSVNIKPLFRIQIVNEIYTRTEAGSALRMWVVDQWVWQFDSEHKPTHWQDHSDLHPEFIWDVVREQASRLGNHATAHKPPAWRVAGYREALKECLR